MILRNVLCFRHLDENLTDVIAMSACGTVRQLDPHQDIMLAIIFQIYLMSIRCACLYGSLSFGLTSQLHVNYPTWEAMLRGKTCDGVLVTEQGARIGVRNAGTRGVDS